jgi:hypothetical protein
MRRSTFFLISLLLSPLAFGSVCEGKLEQPLLRSEVHVPGAESALAGVSSSVNMSVAAVLLRQQLASCGPVDAYAGYKPRTAHDNTPWRFNMKPGQKLNAAEFDAWMRSRGVRVATGRPAAVEAQPASNQP